MNQDLIDYQENLERLEESKKERLYIFLRKVFSAFSSHKDEFSNFIDFIGTLDVLCSLSEYSNQEYVQQVKPIILDSNE